MNERDFVVFARIALVSVTSDQAFACSGVSNAMTTNRFGATPSTAVMFWLRTTYLPPKPAKISGVALAASALKPSGSVISLMSTMK